MKHYIFFIILSIIFSNKIYTQSINKKIDEILLNEINDNNGPGGVFMVAKNGKSIYKKAIGKANLELGIDLTTSNVFQLASMTKQFTAISILMLEEQGKLNTQDSISKYIPDYPNGNKITIHHLLTHTSGIKDFTKMKSLKEIAQKEMSPKMMIDFFKDEPVDFLPGEKFEYNNSGYILLGYIIELTSSVSFEDFVKENIFKKIGMDQSYYASDRKIIKDIAYGYQKKESGYVNKTIINYSVPYASGALMSSLSDMLKWQNALNENVLLKSESLKKAFSKYKLKNGEEITYGYGWRIKAIDGSESREHGGSIFGFKTMAVYIPSEDIYVLGMTNCDCYSPTKIVQEIAKLVLEEYSKN